MKTLIFLLRIQNGNQSDLRDLARERSLQGYSWLRKDELIAFLMDSVQMEIIYNALRWLELRALLRGCGFQDNYRLKKAELIALLSAAPRDDEPMPTPVPTPTPMPSVRSRPPKPMRPRLPPSESSLTLYELERAFRELIGVSELMEQAGWTWKPS